VQRGASWFKMKPKPSRSDGSCHTSWAKPWRGESWQEVYEPVIAKAHTRRQTPTRSPCARPRWLILVSTEGPGTPQINGTGASCSAGIVSSAERVSRGARPRPSGRRCSQLESPDYQLVCSNLQSFALTNSCFGRSQATWLLRVGMVRKLLGVRVPMYRPGRRG
jgi:hypothetical protein